MDVIFIFGGIVICALLFGYLINLMYTALTLTLYYALITASIICIAYSISKLWKLKKYNYNTLIDKDETYYAAFSGVLGGGVLYALSTFDKEKLKD